MMHSFLSRFFIVLAFCLVLSACSSASAASTNPTSTADSEVSSSIQSHAESTSSAPSDSVSSMTDAIPEAPVNSNFSQNSISEQEFKDAQVKFQKIFEQIPAVELYKGQYDGCKRYVLVNDYDGNGSLEAFAFYGIESDQQPQPFWENICIYYINSDYNVIPLAGGGSGYDTYIGSISCPEPYYADDFSNCFYESGNERYLAWNVTYWEGDWFALVLGVHDGEPILSYPGSTFYVNDAGHFATMDDEYHEVILQLKDGKAEPAT